MSVAPAGRNFRDFALAALFVISCTALTAHAGYRPFTFSYDTYPMPKGSFEFEQWVTYKTHTNEEPGFSQFDFREEIEYGLADNFRLGVYVPNWRYENSDAHRGMRFDSVGVEGILLVSNPVTDAVGFGLYGEINVGEHEIEFENKLLLQKDIGDWTLAYNFIVETEVEGIGTEDADNEVDGVLGHTFGVSYGFAPSWRVGAEAIVESVYENWSHYEGTTVYAGPNLSYAGGKIGSTEASWWITVTPVIQLTDEDDEPDYQVRMIAALEF
jgi:hypothetical protein